MLANFKDKSNKRLKCLNNIQFNFILTLKVPFEISNRHFFSNFAVTFKKMLDMPCQSSS